MAKKDQIPDPASSGESHQPVGQSKLLDDLQLLLDSLSHPGLGAKPWAVQLRAGVQQALVQVQILRMTKSMGRPHEEALAAAQTIYVCLRQASVLVAKSRSDELTRMSVRFALELAKRVVEIHKAPRLP